MAELSNINDDFSPADQAAFDAMRAADRASPAPEPEPAASRAPEPAADPFPGREPEAVEDTSPAGEDPQDGEGEEPEGEGETEGNKGQYVRREALRQERERRKSLQKELQEAREQRARLDERLRIFAEANKAAQPKAETAQAEPEAVPDPEQDIFAYARHLEKQVNELRTGFKETQEQTRAREDGERILNSYKADAQQFAAREPAFTDAYQHLYASRARELQFAGMTDPKQILATIAQDEIAIARQAIEMGVSPAERIYQIAQARGFTPKAFEPAPDPAANAKPVGDTAAQKAERAAAGQRGPGRSLSAAGGAPAGGLPTVEQLAKMSEEDFNKFAKNNPSAVTALMGG
jgi:hypothetical protein